MQKLDFTFWKSTTEPRNVQDQHNNSKFQESAETATTTARQKQPTNRTRFPHDFFDPLQHRKHRSLSSLTKSIDQSSRKQSQERAANLSKNGRKFVVRNLSRNKSSANMPITKRQLTKSRESKDKEHSQRVTRGRMLALKSTEFKKIDFTGFQTGRSLFSSQAGEHSINSRGPRPVVRMTPEKLDRKRKNLLEEGPVKKQQQQGKGKGWIQQHFSRKVIKKPVEKPSSQIQETNARKTQGVQTGAVNRLSKKLMPPIFLKNKLC